jgi:hypothetical protein
MSALFSLVKNSPAASPNSGISTRKRRSIDYSQQSSLEYTPGGGDSSELTTLNTNIHQQDPPCLFESLSSIKDESSEHSMDLPMTNSINIPIKQEDDEEMAHQQQPIKSVRTAVHQKSGKGKPTFENRSYGGEISKKRARRVSIDARSCLAYQHESCNDLLLLSLKTLNNGHRRASSPQSSTGSTQITNLNSVRSGTTTGTGLRGRPPKIRKEIPIPSSVRT